MPKYLIQGAYTGDGYLGLLKDGGTRRRETVEALAAAAGGKVEAMYFAHGEDDVYIIVDLPSNVSMTAISLVINASGAAKTKATVLVTPEEVDKAVAESNVLAYRPPGR